MNTAHWGVKDLFSFASIRLPIEASDLISNNNGKFAAGFIKGMSSEARKVDGCDIRGKSTDFLDFMALMI